MLVFVCGCRFVVGCIPCCSICRLLASRFGLPELRQRVPESHMLIIKIISESRHSGLQSRLSDISTVSQITSIRDQYRCSGPVDWWSASHPAPLCTESSRCHEKIRPFEARSRREPALLRYCRSFFQVANRIFTKNSNFTQQYPVYLASKS